MGNFFSLTGKTALIAGAGRGIGRGIALAFAEAGANLILGSRTLSEVEALAEEARTHSIKAQAIRLDIANASQIQTVAAQAIDLTGCIDVLVNNAGTVIRKPAVEITETDWD